MTRVLVGIYSAAGVLAILVMSVFTSIEVYAAFRSQATGFWSTVFAFRGGLLWMGWTLFPYGFLALLYSRSPLLWRSRSHVLQYVVVATGAVLTSALGFWFLTYDVLPFDKSEPRMYFTLLPVAQLLVCGFTYDWWRFHGGKLKKGDRIPFETSRNKRVKRR